MQLTRGKVEHEELSSTKGILVAANRKSISICKKRQSYIPRACRLWNERIEEVNREVFCISISSKDSKSLSELSITDEISGIASIFAALFEFCIWEPVGEHVI